MDNTAAEIYPKLVRAKNILSGHAREVAGANEQLFNERYKLCAECPSKKTASYGEVCGECGCRLQAKLRVPGEACPLNKWN